MRFVAVSSRPGDFFLLLNLSTGETEEETPNKTLLFGCLKNSVLFSFRFNFFYHGYFQAFSKEREHVNGLPCIFHSVLTIKNILPSNCAAVVEKYPLHR